MKKVGIYFFVAVYTLVQLRPVATVLQDVVAHTFFAVQHMATVHYENGRYHVHKELSALNEQQGEAAAKNASSEKNTENTSPQNSTETLLIINTPEATASYYASPDPGLHAGFISPITHPPLFA